MYNSNSVFSTCKFFFSHIKNLKDFIFPKWSLRFFNHFRRKSGDRKNLKFKCRDDLLLSFSLFHLSFFSFSSQLLWFVLTVDWIVDRVKWNQCNDVAKWKPSTGSPDRGCALSWNPRICSTWKIVKNHWKIHIGENKNGSPCANRGDCVDSCSLTKSTWIDYKTLHQSLISLIKSIDYVKSKRFIH